MKLNKINGSLCYTKILENGEKETYESHNALTSLAENMILADSIGVLLSSLSGSEAGLVRAFTPFRFISTGSYSGESVSQSFLPCLYLLNLTEEEKQALNKNMNKNPILKSDLTIDESKLVGYATFDYAGTNDKQGTLFSQANINKLSQVIDPGKFGITFKWAAGKMNGTFNTVVLGVNIFGNKLNSCCLSKGIDTMNTVLGDAASSGYFLCPNVQTDTGVIMTTSEEILLGDGNAANKARRVLNLITGEITELGSSDNRYNAYLYNTMHSYIGNGRILYKNSSGVYVDSYKGTTVSSLKTLNSSCNGYAIKDNFIYTKNRSSSNCVFNAYNMETLNASSSNDITVNIDTSIFTNGFSNLYLSNFMGNFLLTYASNEATYIERNNIGMIFSDLANPMTSFIGTYNGNIGSDILAQNTDKSITKRFYMVSRAYNVKPSELEDYIYPASGTATPVKRSGCKLVFENGYCGQVLSYSVLETPITMNSTEGLIIDYMFHF